MSDSAPRVTAPAPVVKPDLAEAALFLHLMGLSNGDKSTFQTFDDAEEKDPTLAKVFHGNLDAVGNALTAFNGRGAGIFWAVNKTDLRGRAAKNITEVRGVFVDLDGAPLGPVLNSLTPHVVTETSPGRYHAVWRVSDCPREQFGPLQKAIAKRFSGDEACTDLSRCVRLPGFIHRKGEPFASRILQAEEAMGPYTVGQIISGLGLTVEAPAARSPSMPQGEELEIPQGQRNRTLVTIAARFRNTGMTGERLYRALAEENQARCNPPLPDKQVRSIAEWGAKKQPGEIRPARSGSGPQYKNTEQPGRIMTWAELDETPFPDPVWVIRDLLPQGLTILAGRPKVGKSWLCQHLSLAVSAGRFALGKFPVNQGDILHLALEDTAPRFKYRMRKLNGQGEAPANAYFVDQWPRLPGGADLLEKWISEHRHCRLVVIDTLARIRPRGVSRYEGVYDKDYSDIGELQALAGKYSIAVLLIHHERKAEAQDDYDRVSGSIGITGAADTVWILERRDRSVMQGTLIISGRDISDRKYALLWDEQFGLWSYQGSPTEFAAKNAKAEIVQAMLRLGRPCSQSEIGQLCGKTRQAIQKHIPGLLEDGVIEQSAGQRSKYVLVPGMVDDAAINLEAM